MFARGYFPARYFPARLFPSGFTVGAGAGPFTRNYFAGNYFPPRFFPTPSPQPVSHGGAVDATVVLAARVAATVTLNP